ERFPDDVLAVPAVEVVVQIRPADADVPHAQQHLAVGRFGDGDVVEAHVLGAVDEQTLHRDQLQWVRTQRAAAASAAAAAAPSRVMAVSSSATRAVKPSCS